MGACFSCLERCITEELPLYELNPAPVPQRRSLEQQPALLDLPLRAVSVFSSHNSYIRTLQIAATASTDAIANALACGVRCIELDLFRDWSAPSRVFVAHGQEKLPYDILATSQLPLDDALACIASRAFAATTDPLFLALELNMHREEAACNTVAAALVRHFGNRLYGAQVTPETPLRALLGKVVLITGGGSVGSALPPLINAQWNDSTAQNVPAGVPVANISVGRAITRMYPVGDTVAGLLSLNFAPLPALQAGVTFCALNVGTQDVHLDAAKAYFATSSFVAGAFKDQRESM